MGKWELTVWPKNGGIRWGWKAHLPDWNNHQRTTFTGEERDQESAVRAAEDKARKTLRYSGSGDGSASYVARSKRGV